MVQIILFITLTIYLISVYIVVKYNGYGYLSVFFSSYFIFILIVPAFFHVEKNIFPFYNLSYSLNDQFYASLILLIFTIFFWLGFFLKNGRKINTNTNFTQIILKKVNHFRFLFAQLICFSLIIIAILKFGADSFLVKRGEFDRAVFGDNSSTRELMLSGIKSLSFASLFYLIIYKKSLNKIYFYSLFCISLLLFFIVNYPLSLPRFILFSYLIAIYCFFLKPNFRNKILIIFSFAIGITTLFPYISYLTRGDGNFKFDMFSYYQSSGDFDGFQSIINAVIYVNKFGYTHGQQILSSIFSFIPRSVWPNKGEPTGSIIASAAGYDFLNISSPLPAEFYIDFGFFGLIIFSFIFGWLVRFIDQKNDSLSHNGLSYILSIVIISLIVIISRGPILGVLNNAYIEVLVFTIFYFIVFLKLRYR